ncbi:unnamed protein product [Euphydryas editha]|uniref:Uncharacterized protein n=1 Tax=Euphydryas editha TaxID=104508 RepID=A0AAU9V4Q0_EUPED|nr:unnamed protein product [Euphydryas editha]
MLSERGYCCGITDYTRIQLRLNKITKSCIDHIFVKYHYAEPCTAAIDTVLADHRATSIALPDYNSLQSTRTKNNNSNSPDTEMEESVVAAEDGSSSGHSSLVERASRSHLIVWQVAAA